MLQHDPTRTAVYHHVNYDKNYPKHTTHRTLKEEDDKKEGYSRRRRRRRRGRKEEEKRGGGKRVGEGEHKNASPPPRQYPAHNHTRLAAPPSD